MPFAFTLSSFGITNTRALHNDTDYAAVQLVVNSQARVPQVKRIGNVNNGQHNVGLACTLDFPASPSQITFSYLIVNHGGDSAAKVEAACTAALNTAALIAFKPAMATIVPGTTLPVSLSSTLRTANEINPLWNLVKGNFAHLSTDRCDGVVVIDSFSLVMTEALTVALELQPQTFTYSGVDSRDGCGSNSEYGVLWTLGPTN